jgi:hypothetical protein
VPDLYMSFPIVSSFRLVALAFCTATLVFAAPGALEDFPEVIPGPGLPTLASLNLTSAELYRRVPALGRI